MGRRSKRWTQNTDYYYFHKKIFKFFNEVSQTTKYIVYLWLSSNLWITAAFKSDLVDSKNPKLNLIEQIENNKNHLKMDGEGNNIMNQWRQFKFKQTQNL